MTLDSEQQADLLHNVFNGIYKNVVTYCFFENQELFTLFASRLPEPQKLHLARVSEFLEGIRFKQHVKIINEKVIEMLLKATTDINYRIAVKAAQTLLVKLSQAVEKLLNVNCPFDEQSKIAFKESCEEAITKAKPVLAQHRGWKKALMYLLMVLTFPITGPLYAAGFFSTKTNSEQKLNDFEMAISSSKKDENNDLVQANNHILCQFRLNS